MDIQSAKRKAINLIEETNDPSIIEAVIKLLTEKKKDWWDDLTEAQKADIAQGELEFERGEYISYEDMMKKYR